MLVIPLSPIFQLFLLCSQRFTISLMKKKQRKNKLAHKSVGLSLLQMGVRSRADSGRGGRGAAIRCSGSGPAPGGDSVLRQRPGARRRRRMGARSERSTHHCYIFLILLIKHETLMLECKCSHYWLNVNINITIWMLTILIKPKSLISEYKCRIQYKCWR